MSISASSESAIFPSNAPVAASLPAQEMVGEGKA